MFKYSGKGFADEAVHMVFDFGGNLANTEVTVSKITLKEHIAE